MLWMATLRKNTKQERRNFKDLLAGESLRAAYSLRAHFRCWASSSFIIIITSNRISGLARGEVDENIFNLSILILHSLYASPPVRWLEIDSYITMSMLTLEFAFAIKRFIYKNNPTVARQFYKTTGVPKWAQLESFIAQALQDKVIHPKEFQVCLFVCFFFSSLALSSTNSESREENKNRNEKETSKTEVSRLCGSAAGKVGGIHRHSSHSLRIPDEWQTGEGETKEPFKVE